MIAVLACFFLPAVYGDDELPAPVYEYHGVIVDVWDGDTMTADLDLGFDVHLIARLRIEGVDAPEMRGSEKADGIVSRDAVREWLLNQKVVVISRKREKYGRWLARVLFIHDGKVTDLTQHLLETKLAEPYNP